MMGQTKGRCKMCTKEHLSVSSFVQRREIIMMMRTTEDGGWIRKATTNGQHDCQPNQTKPKLARTIPGLLLLVFVFGFPRLRP